MHLIWVFCKSEYFCVRGLTLICPTERFWKLLDVLWELFFIPVGSRRKMSKSDLQNEAKPLANETSQVPKLRVQEANQIWQRPFVRVPAFGTRQDISLSRASVPNESPAQTATKPFVLS